LRLQLSNMGLIEVPTDLFRVKHVTSLALVSNKLCSLPSEISALTKLDSLHVRYAE
jgi:Leucine-rich repeat (LRR) protein